MAERRDRAPAPAGAGEPAACGRRFPEEQLSGFLDGALTQAEEQRVRLHLEDCAACRALYDQLAALRETTMKTRFALPADDQWDERPRGGPSRFLRGAGWALSLAWLLAVAAFAAWQLATGPQGAVGKLAVFAGVAAVALLFLSVLLDRLRALPGDRYRRVKR
jgi:predicted anti-sigma-YlaC factor YlaD